MEHLLDDDEDMAKMYLSEKLAEQQVLEGDFDNNDDDTSSADNDDFLQPHVHDHTHRHLFLPF